MSFIDSTQAAPGPKDEWVPAEQRVMPAQSAAPKDEWVPAEQRAMPAQAKKMTWQDLLPVRIAKGIYESVVSGATLPGDVYAGRARLPSSEGIVPGSVPYGSPESSGERVADLATLVTPPGVATRHGAGWLGAQKTRPVDTVSAEAAANQAAAREFDIPLSRGQASGDLDAIRYEDLAARGAYGKSAQDIAAPFFEDQFQAVQSANRRIGEGFARDSGVAENPSAAAGTVNAELGERAAGARAIDQSAQAAAEREAAATRGMVDDQGRVISDIVAEGHLPIENPREAGEIVGHAVRSAAVRDRANYQGLYDEALGLPGEFHAGTFEGIGNRIQGRLTLGDNPVIIDDVTTPVASRAIRDLDNISGLRIQNRADPFGAPNPEDIVAVDLRGVDQARKRLVAYYRSARASPNAADARAAGRLIDEFDNEVEQAISNGLFSGDPRALEAIQQARAAYSRYAGQFRPRQAGDDVGTAMRRIIDRNATPEEIANMLVGSGRIGNSGLPVRIADRLEEVLGRDSDAWSSIRQAIWQRASQARNEAGGVNTQGIDDLVGSSLGRRMFSPAERSAMRSHSAAARNLDNVIENLGATRAAERSQAEYQRLFGGEGIGGQQATVFRRIIDGTATTEETAQAVFGVISGNPGNARRVIRAIEGIVGRDSEAMAAIRQGVWQRLTQNAETKDQPGQQKVAQAIGEFLNGKGRTISQALYTPEEIALMQRYAGVLRRTVIPRGARTNSDTAPALMSVIHRYGGAVMGAIGAAADGVTGGLAGYAVKTLLSKGAGAVTDARAARRVSQSLAPVDLFPSSSTTGMTPLIKALSVGLAARGLSGTGDETNQRQASLIGSARADEFDPTLLEPEQPGTGERNRPIRLEAPADVHYASGGTVDPTPAQAEAGNYKKRHLRWKGLDIAIETEMGRERTGLGPDGVPWSTVMAHPYGYLKKTTGRDDDPIDVYIGPRPHSQHVFVVDQADPASGRFDEHKVVIGARDAAEASGIYDTGFSDGSGPDRRAAITRMSIPGLKMWLEKGDTTKPVAASSGGRARWASARPSMSLDELLSDPRSAKEIREGMREEFEPVGYADGGSTDELLPPAYLNDSTTRTARAIGDAAVDVAAQPFRDIKRGLSGEMTPDEAKNFAFEAAMGLIPMRAGQALNAGAKGIRAFHGSPHDFDKFDISKIGTGEGAQAYGHGLYFAENPQVAESYKMAGNSHTPRGLALNYLKGYGSRERAISALETDSGVLYPVDAADRTRIAALQLLKEDKLPQSRMYEVNINAHPEQFLDWDKPAPTSIAERFNVPSELKPFSDEALDRYSWLPKSETTTGQRLYQQIGKGRSKEYASDAMRDAGIPGIKYLDQGSRFSALDPDLKANIIRDRDEMARLIQREKSQSIRANMQSKIDAWDDYLAKSEAPQTRNYVLFRDDIVDILRKYGVSSVAALPPAVQAAISERTKTAGTPSNYARGGVVPLHKGTRLHAPRTALHAPKLPKAPKPRKLTLPKLGKF